MYSREIESELLELAKQYPVVTVIGPRQSGKTTLVRHAFPNKPYVNLEAPDTREFALSDPRGFLGKYPEGAILDEIQQAAPLLSYIQVIVDEADQKGMFVLTGSHQLQLHEAITQSLAGRTALLTLLPMSLTELQRAGIDLSLDEALLMGGYPRLFADRLNPTKAYRNYFQTYIERDLRQLISVKDLVQFQRFIRLCAGRVGQLLNYVSLANDVGVSNHTIKHWLSILEASFLVIRLAPFHDNLGKRMVKSPKIYFTDVGLASYLLGLEQASQISRDPVRGNLVENLVLLELLKKRMNEGLDPNLYFYRGSQGHEVDILFQHGRELIPIEVKAGQTFDKGMLKGVTRFQALAGDRAPQGYLVYAGSHEQSVGSIDVINYRQASRIL